MVLKSKERGRKKIDIQELAVEQIGDKIIIRVRLDITASTIDSLEESFFQVMEGVEASVVVMELGEVEVVDSIGVGSLIKIHKGLQKEGKQFILSGMSDDLMELFRWMRLDKHFTIEDHGTLSGE